MSESAEIVTTATETEVDEIPTDNTMIQNLINLKNVILQRIRLNFNNLLTFAKATPLVFIQKKKPIPVSDETRSDFNMRMKMMNALESTGK